MVEDPQSELLAELQAVAGPTARERSDFTIALGGVAFTVEHDGGTHARITLSASFDAVAREDHPSIVARTAASGYRGAPGRLASPRPLRIELRPENGGDRRAKERGDAIEWQSGDERFDRGVYVSTPLNDRAVLSAVLGPEVRQATCALFALGFREVWIDEDGRVRATIREFARGPGARRGERGRPAAEAFALLLANLPRVEASGEGHPKPPLARWTSVLAAIAFAGAFGNVFLLWALIAPLRALFGPEAAEPPTWQWVLIAIVSIIAAALFARPYHRAVLSRSAGSSQAHTNARKAGWAALGGSFVLAFAALVTALVVLRAAAS
jgi:hypothetical protein